MLIRIENSLERMVKSYALKSPVIAKGILKAMIYPRYYLELLGGYQGFLKYGSLYLQKSILIMGLPKSGTTWLEKMLASLPGFQSTMFPGMLYLGFENGEGIEYEFPDDFFSRQNNKLLVIKTHSYASENNLNVIKKNNLRYVVMYRDIRDVAISYVHFVKSRPWHAKHSAYAKLSLEDGLLLFASELSRPYADWVLGWQRVKDANAILISYEQMLANPIDTFINVCNHLKIAMTKQDVEAMLQKFQTSKESREAIHFRKGESGEWKKSFSEEIKNAFKTNIGNALIEMGYESDNNW